MAMNHNYSEPEPARSDIDVLEGLTLVEFGTPWCGHCRAAQPALTEVMKEHDEIRHLKIEDGPGKPLGRSFRVKLWPTLILLRQGEELARVVRPTGSDEIRRAIDQARPA